VQECFVFLTPKQKGDLRMRLGNFDVPTPAVDNLKGAVETRMPKPFRQKMEQMFESDFSQVKVYESHLPTLQGAQAYATGNAVHFAPGAVDMMTETGERAVAHELAHVVQQRGGRVAQQIEETISEAINDNPLEAE
jgi:hypothetical protein